MARTYYTSPGSVWNDVDSRPGYLSAYSIFEKGLTAPPFRFEHNESRGTVRVIFEKTELAKCICQIQCQKAGTIVGPFCPEQEDYSETFTSQVFLEDAATEFLFSFTDGLGNISQFTVYSLLKTTPAQPLTAVDEANILVGVAIATTDATSLKDIATHYQIERYVRNPINKTLWTDWVPVGQNPGTHTDRNAIPGVVHGYRVRLRTTFDNPSRWSDWSTQSIGA